MAPVWAEVRVVHSATGWVLATARSKAHAWVGRLDSMSVHHSAAPSPPPPSHATAPATGEDVGLATASGWEHVTAPAMAAHSEQASEYESESSSACSFAVGREGVGGIGGWVGGGVCV